MRKVLVSSIVKLNGQLSVGYEPIIRLTHMAH